MFSSINTRDRLRRSKSTRSIRKVPRVPEEPFDPELAKRHAAAAAFHAMRSSDKSADSQTSYDRLGGPVHVAVPRRRPNSSLHFTDDTLSGSAGPVATPVTPRQSMEQPGTTHSQSFADSADLPETDIRGLDGRHSSIPSSYRRLRKAKSMFSTGQRSTHLSFGTSPKLCRDPHDADPSPRHELPRTLRPSISFMRANKTRTVRHAKSQDAAIHLARHQFLEEANASQPRRSSFFTRRTREHKPFRKTFRIASGTGIGGESPEQPLHRRARSKSRTFSASIKQGLKRVFGLSKLVDQQSDFKPADASNDLVDPVLDYQQPPAVDHELQNYAAVPPLPTMRSSPSHDSPCTSASRVTSWADSSVPNTVVARKSAHRQSLSLIEEHGDLNKELPRLPVNAARDDRLFSGRESARRLDGVVNSQDLYTALMQQIRQNAVHSSDGGIHFGTVPEHRVIPERTSSAYSRSRVSIRHIQSGDSTPVSFTTARRGDSQSPQRQPQSTRYVLPIRKSRCSFDSYQSASLHPATQSPQFEYIIDEVSDEDTGSVVMARTRSNRSISPSIYSRTTSGNTPKQTNEDSDADERTLFAEPGTATIYASERHSSPTRSLTMASPKDKVQPSADWQQWMNSQIDRIENASPTRGHFREDAQAQEEEDEIFMGMMRRAPPQALEVSGVPYVFDADVQQYGPQSLADARAHMQSNFSRPFSRSSSVRTIMPSQNIEANGTALSSFNPADTNAETITNMIEKTPALPTRSPLRPRTANGANLKSSSPADPDAAPDVVGIVESPPSPLRSPMRLRTGNLPEAPDSPTPNGAQNRAWTHDQYRRYSLRRPIANGRQPQFRSMRTYGDIRPLNNENTRGHEHDEMMAEYHRLGERALLSSKHMVEDFLNRRRRPTETSPVEKNADEAFI